MESKTSDSTDVELTTDKFEDLDLNAKTKKVLKAKGYVYLTKVQSKVLPLALSGKNLVIQSPTGSGKTLCFLLPTVKHLFDEGYSGNLPIDANLLGCICLAPTRELASQISLQMKDLATPLKLNSGCCIGGVRDKYDKKNANRLHILTGTPGRILALLSSQSLPDTHNIKILILDEADRLIDTGFRDDIVKIVDFLPADLQFMFFSATIKSSLKELCDFLLRDVNYELVCLGADVECVSESFLRQEFMTIPPKLKISALFYLLSKNQGSRVIVFLGTCKLVRFCYEVFKRLIPAVPMTELHGRQSQNKRLKEFTKFAARQNHGCIFTTDLAARGLDFPAVDLVVQFDSPEGVSGYTHRAGRTGRLSEGGVRKFGKSFLFLTPNEDQLLADLKRNGLKLHDQTKLCTPLVERRMNYVTRKMQALLAKESWIKDMAQRAIVAHLRYLNSKSGQKLKSEDVVQEINQLSLSFGLPFIPNIQVVSNTGSTSKLSKLKNKIKMKKLAKSRPESNHVSDDAPQEDNATETSNGNHLNGKEEDEEEDVLFMSKENDLEDFKDLKDLNKDKDRDLKRHLNSSRLKLRLNRRGVAKLRGVLTIAEGQENHVFFSDDDQFGDPEDEARKLDYVEKLQGEISKHDDADKAEYSQIRREHKRAKKT